MKIQLTSDDGQTMTEVDLGEVGIPIPRWAIEAIVWNEDPPTDHYDDDMNRTHLEAIDALHRALGTRHRREAIASSKSAFGPGFLAVFKAVLAERKRQLLKGYTPEHDDEHSVADFCDFISSRLKFGSGRHRQSFIEIAALAVAVVESIDRRAAPSVVSTPQKEREAGRHD